MGTPEYQERSCDKHLVILACSPCLGRHSVMTRHIHCCCSLYMCKCLLTSSSKLLRLKVLGIRLSVLPIREVKVQNRMERWWNDTDRITWNAEAWR
jgi:hypothetical protein